MIEGFWVQFLQKSKLKINDILRENPVLPVGAPTLFKGFRFMKIARVTSINSVIRVNLSDLFVSLRLYGLSLR